MTTNVGSISASKNTRLRRPVYTENKDNVTVTYYDGKKWNNTVFDKDSSGGKIGIDITKFIKSNAFKNNGNIKAEDMKNAWNETVAKNLANLLATGCRRFGASRNDPEIISIDVIFREMRKIIDTCCEDGIVNQKEQSIIMTAIANFMPTITYVMSRDS